MSALSRSSSHGFQVAASSISVVMTYAPMEGAAAINDLKSLAGGGWSVRHVVIHELSQVWRLMFFLFSKSMRFTIQV